MHEEVLTYTRRELMQAVFSGAALPVPPVCIRIDLWYQDAVSRGALPEEWSGDTVAGIEDRLGFCRSARWRARPRLVFPGNTVKEADQGDQHITRYDFPGAALEKVEQRTVEQARAGMRGTIVRYPVSDEASCRALLKALENARLEADLKGFADFDRETGDAGLPLLILGSCPAHALMLDWFGYQNFFYALADYPEKLSELISALETIYRRDLWEKALRTPAELIMHGNHFADTTTPPPLFRRFFLPYFQQFNARVHEAGKKVLWHADAEMGTLMELVLEAGFNGADCLATAPLVKQTMADYDQVWRGRIVSWGGLPGTLFNPEVPESEFLEHVRSVQEFTRDRPGCIIGASDNVMPGACWKRIKILSDQLLNPVPIPLKNAGGFRRRGRSRPGQRSDNIEIAPAAFVAIRREPRPVGHLILARRVGGKLVTRAIQHPIMHLLAGFVVSVGEWFEDGRRDHAVVSLLAAASRFITASAMLAPALR